MNIDMYPDLTQESHEDLETATYHTKQITDQLNTNLGPSYSGRFISNDGSFPSIEPGITYTGLNGFNFSRVLGKGGFSRVYEGTFHGQQRAFKFSPMRDGETESNTFTNKNQGVWEYRRHVKGSDPESRYQAIVDKPIAFMVVEYKDQLYFVIGRAFKFRNNFRSKILM